MDAGYSMFAGLDIDPSDYLNDNSGAAGWPAPAEEQPIQYASPPADGRSVSQPRRSLPQMPSIDFSGIFENLRQHYPKLFWLLVVPGTAVALGSGLLNGNVTTDTAINTVLSPQTQSNVFQAAVGIVLDQPIPTAEGVRPATASEILDSGKRVMAQQESQLLQRKVNEWMISMTLGQATPDHPCYQLSTIQCISVQQRNLDERWQLANQVGNTDELLTVAELSKALDRVREGRTEPHQWQPDLYQFARVKYLTATQQVAAQTPNGVAQTLLNMQQESAQQAGMMYNPQTGQLEPSTQP